MLKILITLANKLDKLGLYSEADTLDEILKQATGMDPDDYEKYYGRPMDADRLKQFEQEFAEEHTEKEDEPKKHNEYDDYWLHKGSDRVFVKNILGKEVDNLMDLSPEEIYNLENGIIKYIEEAGKLGAKSEAQRAKDFRKWMREIYYTDKFNKLDQEELNKYTQPSSRRYASVNVEVIWPYYYASPVAMIDGKMFPYDDIPMNNGIRRLPDKILRGKKIWVKFDDKQGYLIKSLAPIGPFNTKEEAEKAVEEYATKNNLELYQGD